MLLATFLEDLARIIDEYGLFSIEIYRYLLSISERNPTINTNSQCKRIFIFNNGACALTFCSPFQMKWNDPFHLKEGDFTPRLARIEFKIVDNYFDFIEIPSIDKEPTIYAFAMKKSHNGYLRIEIDLDKFMEKLKTLSAGLLACDSKLNL